MTTTIHLLGQPRIEESSGDVYQFRSRKSWALLAFLLLNERPPSRRQLASLLFAEADDPLRALRWSLSEIRRSLGDEATVDGDPVVVQLPSESVVDVALVSKGAWSIAIDLPGLGSDLLDGISPRGAPAFESWLLSEQRHIAAASEAILHEAALGSMSGGDMRSALRYATRAAMMSPLDENHQALLIQLYRLNGDEPAAEQQFAACTELFDRELGIVPGPAIQTAMYESRSTRPEVADAASVAALVESGSAAVAAGSTDAGVRLLRDAVRAADSANRDLRVRARLVLAEALVHSLRGFDEEGLTALYEAERIAISTGDRQSVAHARAEIGYVDFLRARYDRADLWLSEALDFVDDSPSMMAKVTTYRGSVQSDRANYDEAIDLLQRSIEWSRQAGEPRREIFALSMLGRISLIRNDLVAATEQLDASIKLAQKDHWLAFLPWPQALRGEVSLALDDLGAADELLRQAFARACQLGDPCWEGMAARGLALLADAKGETATAFAVLADARSRCNRLADPYVWLDGHILDAQCELAIRHGRSEATVYVDRLGELASRTGMKELTVRALMHGAALGRDGDASAAALIAAGINNPQLQILAGLN